MRLKDTGLTVQDIKDKVNKYMIETYERFDFLAETAEGMYMYDENGTPYLDFYAGIAVNNAGNRNPKVVAAAKEQLGLDLDKKKLQLSEPVRSFGVVEVPIMLHTKVTGKLSVHVVEE